MSRSIVVDYRRPEPLLKGADAATNSIIGMWKRRAAVLARLERRAAEAVPFSDRFRNYPDKKLRAILSQFREAIRRGGNAGGEPLLPALGAVREAAFRKLGLRPFPVQLAGALALHEGMLAEMATGEGKTLTAGIAAVLMGWKGKPCHIVTVNDYLVERDSEGLRRLYEFCGLTVAAVTGGMETAERREAYRSSVVYATSKELAADLLRDNLRVGAVRDPGRRLIRHLLGASRDSERTPVLRGLHSAIIDEADSVLIDEAVTPLIISTARDNPMLREAVNEAWRLSAILERGVHYTADFRYREIELTEEGIRKIAAACEGLPGMWRGFDRRNELLRQALSAREFFVHGHHYYIADGKVVIVDEFTGRPMPDRTWRQGMHQTIEAKESLEVSHPSETIARISFQRFFRSYYKLSGMTGTAREAAPEFWQVYGLPVVTIPTNRPCVREHWPLRVFRFAGDKLAAIVESVKELRRAGRPVLIGTRTVAASEHLARLLQAEGVEIELLNATRLREEARIVANAGHEGRVTLATNMAGRGTDIVLAPGVAEKGGLHVIASEPHEAERVDRQLFGRSGRQGDPGSAQLFVCADDELFRKHLPRPEQYEFQYVCEMSRYADPSKMARRMLAMAQGRSQDLAYRQRKSVLRSDTWLADALSFAGSDEV